MWNTESPAEVETLGENARPGVAYSASKTIAEQSSWVWVKEHAQSWDFIAILPTYTFGPYIHQVRQAVVS